MKKMLMVLCVASILFAVMSPSFAAIPIEGKEENVVTVAQSNSIKWTPVCMVCKARGGTQTRSASMGPPQSKPMIPGRCLKSATKKDDHQGYWESK